MSLPPLSQKPSTSDISNGEVAVAGCQGLGITEVVVVRHGETSWNASRKIQGHLDVELNEIGTKQAAEVGKRLSREPDFVACYSSDLKRAVDTAQIISKMCNLPEVLVDPGLRERNLGDLQGMTLQDAAKKIPKAYKSLLSAKVDQEIPGGGESINQLHQRCTSAMQAIAMKHNGRRVLLVTHGGVLREFYKRAVPGKTPERGIPNSSVSVFHISANGNDWSLKTWVDTSHLTEAGFMKDTFGGDRTSG